MNLKDFRMKLLKMSIEFSKRTHTTGNLAPEQAELRPAEIATPQYRSLWH
jgi:hypothetical protein